MPALQLLQLSRGEGAVVELYVVFDGRDGGDDVDVVVDGFEGQFDAVDGAVIGVEDAVRDLLRAGA